MGVDETCDTLRARLEARLQAAAYGLECGDGWLMLLGELDHEIARYDPAYSLAQVKAKFGTLRFYVDLSDDLTPEAREAVHELIREAEERSSTVCELCGGSGVLRRLGWSQVLCNACVSGAK